MTEQIYKKEKELRDKNYDLLKNIPDDQLKRMDIDIEAEKKRREKVYEITTRDVIYD